METVLYIKGQRMRNEIGGNVGFTTILQCDLKRTLTINEKNKNLPDLIQQTARTLQARLVTEVLLPLHPPRKTQPQRGGVVNIVNTITDTGERKEMFGFTARRIKTSMVKTASPDACDKDAKVETDGWYIDFQYAFECPGQTQKHPARTYRPQPGCKDDIRTKTIGTAKLGFPLLVTTTIYQPDGRTSSMTQEVLELSREPLSASLFDIPEGYTLAKDMQQLYGMGAATSVRFQRSDRIKAQPHNDQQLNRQETRRDSYRIVCQTCNGESRQRNRCAIASLITSIVQVSKWSRSQPASQAMEEARKNQCDYMLSASMTVKKGGGGSMFGRAIGNIAGWRRSLQKAKDEVTLEYKLDHIETAKTAVTNKDKAKGRRRCRFSIGPKSSRRDRCPRSGGEM